LNSKEALLSILLPTVNPNERVVSIISELLECKQTNFELVVSLNAPSQSLELQRRHESDKRLVISIEPERLNVADNWTKVVEKSSGKYLWLIGDDDYILCEQLLQVLVLLEREKLDCLSFNGWSYIFPSEMTKNLALSRPYHFNYQKSILGVLTHKSCEKIIRNMYRFVPLIPLNMQLTIFSRDTFESIGGFFKMPFPDHIALMEFLVAARIWKVVDERWCIVGMAPTSFGNSAYQSSDSAGEAYLGLTQSKLLPIPGNILNSVMLNWLETLSNTNPRFQRYRPSRGNYILRQIGVNYRRWRSGDIDLLGLLRNIKRIPIKDLLLATRSLFIIKNIVLIFKVFARKPGPEKIIGAKFQTTKQVDIKAFADDIRLLMSS
jgi:glycosyltransferase involved in cell wall biosynthesis